MKPESRGHINSADIAPKAYYPNLYTHAISPSSIDIFVTTGIFLLAVVVQGIFDLLS